MEVTTEPKKNAALYLVVLFQSFSLSIVSPSLMVLCTGLNSSLSKSISFTYCYMVLFDTSFYAGWLLGYMLLLYFLTKVPPRIIVIGGNILTLTLGFLFGLSSNLILALLFRFLWGLAYATVMTAASHKTRVDPIGMLCFYAVVLGVSFGSLINGLTFSIKSEGDEQNTNWLKRYPSIMPLILWASFSMISLFLVILYLPSSYSSSSSSLVLHNTRESTKATVSGNAYRALDSIDDEESQHSQVNLIATEANDLDATTHGSSRENEKFDNKSPQECTVNDIGTVIKSALKSPTRSLNESLDYNESESTKSVDTLLRQKRRNRVLFDGMVTVKVIGSDSIAYSQLKRVTSDEEPVDDVELEQSNNRPIYRYSNGSEHFANSTSYRFSVDNIYRTLAKSSMVSCLTMIGAISVLISFSIELFQGWVIFSVSIESSKDIRTFPVLALSLYEFFCTFLPLCIGALIHKSVSPKSPTLFLFRQLLNIFAFTAIVLSLLPILDKYVRAVAIQTVLALLLLIMAVSVFLVFQLSFMFISHITYNHERVIVSTATNIVVITGLLVGSAFGGFFFILSERSRSIIHFDFHWEWWIAASLAKVVRHISLRLPRKVQRRVREPLNPRYATLMLTGHANSNDEDLLDEEADNSEDEFELSRRDIR